jgi:LPS-assembly protein
VNRSAGHRTGLMRALMLGAALSCAVLPAAAQGLVPADFFNAPVDPAAPTGVEANTLSFDSVRNLITASGQVVLTSSGYTVKGDALTYDRNTNAVKMTGDVTVIDPSGNVMETTDLDLTDGLKKAFLDALVITSYDGSKITADSADYDEAIRTILTNATYAPCGECVDAKGRRIGWSMKAPKLTKNEDGSVYIEQPVLSLLGIPVAWLPFFYMPDLSDYEIENAPRPTYSYSDKTGHAIGLRWNAYSSKWTDVFLNPKYMSRQGFFQSAILTGAGRSRRRASSGRPSNGKPGGPMWRFLTLPISRTTSWRTRPPRSIRSMPPM